MKKLILFMLVIISIFSMTLLTACNNKENDETTFKSTTIYAQVLEIDGDSFNIVVGSIGDGGQGEQPGAIPNDGEQPNMPSPDGQGQAGMTPPDGQGQAGMTPPDGQGQAGMTPPDGQGQAGMTPPDGQGQPDNIPSGEQPNGVPNNNFVSLDINYTITIDSSIPIVKNNQTEATKTDIVVGSILQISFDENGNVTKVNILAMDNIMQGGNFTHGSEETVTEDMLTTTIREGYDVNSETQAKASKGVYLNYFNTEAVENVYLSIDENNWNYMLQNAMDKPTVLANSITIGGKKVEYVGIKTKGNLTLSSVWNSNSDRFSFTVNFGKYIKKKGGYSENQNFYGLAKVAFNDIYGDATLMKEYLSYCLMTEMGVDTPAYSLVNLYVNDSFWGVYLMLESIDSAITQRTIDEKSDYLVKPESMGGDLIYNSALDAYYDSEAGAFDFTDILYSDEEHTQLIYPSDRNNPLYAYGGLWENDEDTFADVVEMLPTVFKWMKTLNELSNSSNPNTQEYKDAVESIVDVDKLIRYFAVNTYLVNLDSYQSEKMQNYALYISESGKANVMPWDYNFSFGAYGVGNASAMVNFNIDSPLLNATLNDRPLLKIIFNNDDYKALYHQYLNDCTIISGIGGTTSDDNEYAANNFASKINALEIILSENYANDPTAFYTVSQYESAIVALKTLIKDRNTAVKKQLAGDFTTVTTSVSLNILGDVTGSAGNADKR